MVEIDTSAMRSVYPSGLATATDWAPTAPAAPGLFVTTTACFSVRSSAAASGRAVRSAMPPGGNGTTTVIGRVGYGSSAEARPATTPSKLTAITTRLIAGRVMGDLLTRRAHAGDSARHSTGGRRETRGRSEE